MPPHRLARVALWTLCALSPGGLAAQQPTEPPPITVPRLAVGGQAGYSRTNVTGAAASQVRSREGALTGVFLQFPVAGVLSVRPEILFALKGGSTQTPTTMGTAPAEVDLAYIEAPILLRATPGKGRFRATVFGGPAPALKIGCDLRILGTTETTALSCGDASLPVRDVDFGIVAGGGVEVRWPQSALALEARYNVGVRSIFSNGEARNRAFGLLLALTF